MAYRVRRRVFEKGRVLKVAKNNKDKPVLKKAQPMDDSTPSEVKPSGRGSKKSGNPLHKLRDAGAAAADTAANAAKKGLQQLIGGLTGMPGAAKALGSAVLGKTAQSFGVSKTTAGIGIGIIGIFGGLGAVTTIAQYQSAEQIYRQEGYVDDCAEALYNESQVQTETTDLEGDEMMYAEMMYGILANLGCSPVQCAGAISSMAAESGLDPTAVEGIYNEKYQIGPRKSLYVDGNTFTPAIEEHFAWLQAHTAKTLSVKGYTGVDGRKTCGLGLLQFTGGSANGVMAMAEAAGKMWYDFDVQMAYMMSDQSGFGPRVKKFKELSETATDPKVAADLWTQYVEMGGGAVASDTLETHRAKAEGILSELGRRHEALQSEYAEMASGVQEMAGSNFDTATANRSSEVEQMCGEGDDDNGLDGVYDNAGMAKLMTLYCYQDYKSAEATATGGNPQKRGGTKLYQELRDTSTNGRLNSDSYWNSCDRGVATAVICSGADDNFSLGGCRNMLAYMLGCDKWAEVGPLNDVSDRLEPGDICIHSNPAKQHGHVIMYTSTELNSAEGGQGEISSASYGQRYPGMGTMREHYIGSDNYTVFRYTGSFDGANATDLSALQSPIDHH